VKPRNASNLLGDCVKDAMPTFMACYTHGSSPIVQAGERLQQFAGREVAFVLSVTYQSSLGHTVYTARPRKLQHFSSQRWVCYVSQDHLSASVPDHT